MARRPSRPRQQYHSIALALSTHCIRTLRWTMAQEADSSARCNVLVAILILVAAVLMWPILFALRADGDIDCSWGIVWIPLWIFYSFGLMLAFTAVAQVGS